MPSSSQTLLLPLLLLAASAALGAQAAVNCDNQNGDTDGWVRHGASCYRWVEDEDYWYPAEQRCRAAGGHLVSIRDQQENTLVARLTYCRPAWIGRYGVSADHLGDPCNYRWTDRRPGNCGYQRHNFSRLATPHQPLVTAEDLQWHNNFYHARSTFVCEAPASPPADNRTGEAAGCPGKDWRRLGDHCYHQPAFPATYIEAGYYCDGKQSQLVSVHTAPELRLLSLLDLSQATCPVELWVGLVKLNPCRREYFTGRQICYAWADRSGNHTGFPAWASGHPNSDSVTNCAVLKDRSLRSEPCHLRRHFVCKRPAELTSTLPPPRTTSQMQTSRRTSAPATTSAPRTTSAPGTTPLPPGKIKAAYDFRRGLENLAQPGRFRVLDVGHAGGIGGPQGALLNGSRGILLDTESSALTRPLKRGNDWTIFYYVRRPTDYDEIVVDVSSAKGGEPSLTAIENPHSSDLSLFGGAGYFRDESDPGKDTGSGAPAGWLRAAVVLRAGRAYFYRNGVDASSHRPATSTKPYPDHDEHLMLGNAYNSVLPGYRGAIACFGVSHSALSRIELAAAFQRYCP